MVVDDLVVCGARPLFMTDYLVCGRLIPERVAAIVGGVADGCVLAGCALIGGETAEHPGHLAPDDFDLAGAATGVVDAGDLLGPDRVRPGDVVVALASSGLHANGFSLVRRDPGGRGRAWTWRPARPSSAGRWARSCSRRPASTPVTASALAARLRRARLRARDRGRAGGQPGQGAAAGCRRSPRSRQLAAAAGIRAAGRARRRCGPRRWNGSSTWAWAWPPCSDARRRRPRAGRAGRAAACPAWVGR